MNVTFTNTPHHLHPLVTKDTSLVSSLKVLGQPIIIRNIEILRNVYKDINTIRIEDKYSQEIKLLQNKFPSIEFMPFHDNDYQESNDHREREIKRSYVESQLDTDAHYGSMYTSFISNDGTAILQAGTPNSKARINQNGDSILHIPLNSVLSISQTQKRKTILVDAINYPWDFLTVTQKILFEEIKETRISSNTSVAKSCIIDGPCIIEEGSTIDDFSKIRGPTYIGKDSFIGMGSLVRNCMCENNTTIGFNCEVGKSYFAGSDKISHQNVILDSIIGTNVWFGGYSGTTNVLLNRRNVKYEIDNILVNTGTDHFGTVVGNNCAIGASVIILPGRQVQPNSTIQAGTIVGSQ